MKIKMILITLILAGLSVACSNEGRINTNPGKPKTFMDSVSYFIGNSIGQQLNRDSLNINYDYFVKGVKDAMKNDSTFMSKAVLEKISASLQSTMMKKQEKQRVAMEEQMKKEGAENMKKTETFLKENKTKPGVKETPSGLQYIVLKQGSGKIPKMDDLVEFNLRAYDMNGNKFDDSYQNGQPIKIGVKDQVKGWQEAFLMMKEGSIYKVFLPPALGWGEKGIPGKVSPGSVVIFELELIKIAGKVPDEKNPMPVQPVK